MLFDPESFGDERRLVLRILCVDKLLPVGSRAVEFSKACLQVRVVTLVWRR